MAIANANGIIAGCKPGAMFFKTAISMNVARSVSLFYTAGIPGAAVAPTPGINGEALTSYPGQIPFTNPGVGQTSYLARFSTLLYASVSTAVPPGTVLLADRLWHNSGITLTSAALQTLTSVAFPPRDANGTSDGLGVLLGLEISAATSAGASNPTITLEYTNENNVARTIAGGTAASTTLPTGPTPIGTFSFLSLYGSDRGVRSVQSITFTNPYTGGTAHLVAYRRIANVLLGYMDVANDVNPLTGGMPIMYDNTVPFIVVTPTTTNTCACQGMMTVTQG